MIVTDIKKKNKRIKELFVDNEFFSLIDIAIIENEDVNINDDFTMDELKKLKKKSDLKLCKEYALKLLGYRSYSKKELYGRLQAKFDDQISQSIVDLMEDLKFIEDDVVADKLADSYINKKYYGEKKAIFEMVAKGIPKEMAIDAVNRRKPSHMSENIKKLINLKYKNKIAKENGERKIVAALARRGYEYDDIKIAVSEIYKNT